VQGGQPPISFMSQLLDVDDAIIKRILQQHHLAVDLHFKIQIAGGSYCACPTGTENVDQVKTNYRMSAMMRWMKSWLKNTTMPVFFQAHAESYRKCTVSGSLCVCLCNVDAFVK
jgi:hypothetical protein